METWNLFTTTDLFMAFMALAGFAAVAVVLKTAFKVNRNG
jgi:hypothetical protein